MWHSVTLLTILKLITFRSWEYFRYSGTVELCRAVVLCRTVVLYGDAELYGDEELCFTAELESSYLQFMNIKEILVFFIRKRGQKYNFRRKLYSYNAVKTLNPQKKNLTHFRQKKSSNIFWISGLRRKRIFCWKLQIYFS